MAVEMPVSQVQPVKEVSEAEIRQWFEKHPTLLTFPFTNLTTKLKEQIINFELWFERYLADKAYCKDQEVETFAKEYECARVMTWIWMNTEYVHDDEVAHYIQEAGELFYKKNATCADCDPDQYKTNISVIVQALLLSFRHVEGPRVLKAIRESQREIVPEAQVPHDTVSSDDEPGTGNTFANLRS